MVYRILYFNEGYGDHQYKRPENKDEVKCSQQMPDGSMHQCWCYKNDNILLIG